MDSLISLDGLAKVANNLIDKLSNAVGWIATHDTPNRIAVDTYIKDIQNSNYDPITKASLISQAKKTIKEYSNQKNIVNTAISMITPTARPNDINEDWLLQFMDKARLVSDVDFQLIWANILARECNSPGTIPKALLYTLEQMDKETATAFMSVASVSFNYVDDDSTTSYCPIILMSEHRDYYRSIGINLNTLIELQSLGLIKMGETLTTYSLKLTTPVVVNYHGEEYCLSNSFPVGEVVYTRNGEVLCSVVKPEKVDGFFEKICVPLWKKENADNNK